MAHVGPETARAPQKVLFIAGAGRSGSTLLDHLLGLHPDLVAVGELAGLWGRGLRDGGLCGCGSPVPTCPFWQDVVSRLPGWAHEPERVVRLQAQVLRTRRLPAILRHPGRGPLGTYRELSQRLYRAVAAVAGVTTVVDSTKKASLAALSASDPGVELTLVHLVRDPRAVAYSWGNPKPVPLAVGERLLPRRGPLDASISWVAANVGAELVARRSRAVRTSRVRYEDLVTEPERVLADLRAAVGAPEAVGSARPATVHHTVSGNPNRFSAEPLQIEPDERWRTAMRRRDRVLVTAVAGPLLARYGYGLTG